MKRDAGVSRPDGPGPVDSDDALQGETLKGEPKDAAGGLPEASLSRVFVGNLLGILALGVAVSGWILYYTEWFPALGGLLALGGILSWLAFVSRILSEERLKAIQGWADQSILSSRTTSVVLVVLAVCGLAAANLLGAIQVESLRESTDRFVTLHPIGSDADEVRLPAGEVIRKPVWTSWWRPATWRVKVSGYPDQVVPVSPWPRVELTVPASFLTRPVVLIRPTVELFDEIHHNPRVLTVQVGKIEFSVPRFSGRSFWIGCDDDVDVPLRLELAWRAEAEARQRGSVVSFWLHPESFAEARRPLRAGTEIVATLFDQNGKPSLKRHTVRSESAVPQEVVLDVQK